MDTHWLKDNERDEASRLLWKGGFYMLLPLALICVPTSWLESRPSICLIRHVIGRPCPGCGMTRAISCVFHANFTRAWRYNKLVVLVFPLLCFSWFRAMRAEYKKYLLTKSYIDWNLRFSLNDRAPSSGQGDHEGSPNKRQVKGEE